MSTEKSPPSAGTLRRVAHAITLVELVIGGIAVMLILVLVSYQALQRYLPVDSIAWTGELARFCLLWATFAAMGVLVTRRGHIALEIVDSLRSPVAIRIIQVFALLVVAATGIGLTLEAIGLVSTQSIVRSPVLRVPMSWVYIPVLIGAISTTIRALISAVDVALHGAVFADIDDEEVVA